MQTILSIVGVLFAFGLVIFIHELGHFLVAKKLGVKVEQFSFGFGKEIFGFQWGETRYTVNWLPLGGFVKMAGELPEDYEGPSIEKASAGDPENLKEDKSREFMAKPWYGRILIALAGPAMNYVMASFIFAMIVFVWGKGIPVATTKIDQLLEGRPAQQAGLKQGDIISHIDGDPVTNFESMAAKINAKANTPIEVQVLRDNETFKYTVVPEDRGGKGLIGIAPATEVIREENVGFVEALGLGVQQSWFISKFTLGHLYSTIRKGEKPDVAGPIGIVQVLNRAVKKGWEEYWGLIGLISVAIGLFNLFPIPMLDGGHILYYLIEGIRGKPLSSKTMGRAQVVGLVFLLGLLVFATTNDLKRKWPDQKSETVPEGTLD